MRHLTGSVEHITEQSLPPEIENVEYRSRSHLLGPAVLRNEVTWEDLDRGRAPVDDIAGVPLPLLQTETPLHIIKHFRTREEFCREDNHHAFFENRELTSEGGRVLRHSRLQYGSRWVHARYHMLFEKLEWIPQTEIDEFRVAVLSVAGYVPDYAVDVGGSVPKIKRLHPWEHKRLVAGDIGPEQRWSNQTERDLHHLNRGMFFMKQALSQKFDHVKQTLLEEFLETKSSKRRLEVGLFIIDMGFLRAMDDVSATYRVAHQKGYIHPSKRKDPVGFLRSVVDGYQPDYFETLADVIKQQYSSDAVA